MKVVLYWLCLVFFSTAFIGQASTNQCHLRHQGKNQRPLRIVYFTPGTAAQEFWRMHTDFMKAVAIDLGIELEIQTIEAVDQNRFHFSKLVKKQLKQKKPDYVVGPLFRNGEKALLDTIEALAIPFLSINTSISPANLQLLGLPRQNYRYWLGHLSPNNIAAGHDLAQTLASHTDHRHGGGPAIMLAISGANNSTVSQHREEGLATAANPKTIALLPVIHTNWRAPAASAATRSVLQRGLEIDLIWTVGADTAAGVVTALLDHQIIPGKQIKIGTMDWSPAAFKLIKKGYVDVSYGGHFMEGGWAMILLLDHANQLDYADELGVNIATRLQPLTKHNLALFGDAILKQNWQSIDFKQLSKCFNRQRKSYDFSLNVLQQ